MDAHLSAPAPVKVTFSRAAAREAPVTRAGVCIVFRAYARSIGLGGSLK